MCTSQASPVANMVKELGDEKFASFSRRVALQPTRRGALWQGNLCDNRWRRHISLQWGGGQIPMPTGTTYDRNITLGNKRSSLPWDQPRNYRGSLVKFRVLSNPCTVSYTRTPPDPRGSVIATKTFPVASLINLPPISQISGCRCNIFFH